jgi:hypothetical protein
MSDLTDAADSMAESTEPTPPTMAEAQATAESGTAEGTTPEEVAAILKSGGIDLPAEPTITDEEEGDEPDAPVAGDAAEEDAAGDGKPAEEVANEEPVEPAAKPETAFDSETGTEDKYSFTVEDANGVTRKISAGDNLEEVLGEDFELKNQAQAMEIMRRMDKVEAQKADDDKKAQEDAAEAENAKAIEDIQVGWNNEFKDLDINEEGRREEIMKYMSQENDKRQADGKPLIRTVEHALLGLEKQEAKAAEDKAAKDAKDTARKNGALVGGSSAPAAPASNVYKAGSARNVNEAIRATGLL